MTRRRMIRIAALAALTAGAGHATGAWRRLARRLDWRRSRVALLPCAGYGPDLSRQVARAWDLGLAPDVSGARVLLKPNIVDFAPGVPINTDPRFLAALIDLLRARGAREVRVAEGPGNRRDIATVLGETGLDEVLGRRRVPFVDLNTDDLVRVRTRALALAEPSRIPELLLPATVLAADVVVSVAKLKTHHWTGVTLAMKNLFGLVPGSRYGWPKNLLHWNGLDRSVLEIFRTVKPAFGLVDGIVGMEGDGPLAGSPRESGVILASRDLVALDATAARAMGVRPDRVLYLDAAGELGLGRPGEGEIELAGEPLARHVLRFALPAGFEAMRG
jgi:uncharacterized protein (DUF362 family)